MTDFAGESRYAIYRRFSIGDESQGFKLLVEDYQGTAGLSRKLPSDFCVNMFTAAKILLRFRQTQKAEVYRNGDFSPMLPI